MEWSICNHVMSECSLLPHLFILQMILEPTRQSQPNLSEGWVLSLFKFPEILQVRRLRDCISGPMEEKTTAWTYFLLAMGEAMWVRDAMSTRARKPLNRSHIRKYRCSAQVHRKQVSSAPLVPRLPDPCHSPGYSLTQDCGKRLLALSEHSCIQTDALKLLPNNTTWMPKWQNQTLKALGMYTGGNYISM